MEQAIRDFLEEFGIILIVIVMVCLVLASCVGGIVLANKNYCDNMIKLMPDQHFTFLLNGGCLMQLSDGTWTPAQEYLSLHRQDINLNNH